MILFIQNAFCFEFSIKEISESLEFEDIGTSSANYFKSKKFDNKSNCYHGNCLYDNFKPMFDLIASAEKILSSQDQKMMKISFKKLDNFKKRKVLLGEIDQVMTPLFKTLFTLDSYDNELKIYPVYYEIVDILHACSSTKYYSQYLKGKSPISTEQFFIATQLCKKRNGNIFNFLNIKEGERCEKLLRDSFEIIDLKGQPGTFATYYVQFILDNHRFDKFIFAFNERLKKSKNFLGNNPRIAPRDEKLVPESIKNLDLGKIAFEVTGNLKDALRLLQLTVSDPGASMINKLLRVELRKKDTKRFSKLSSYISEINIRGNKKISNMAVNMFGQSFKRNWSIRNYKMLAGAVLSLELMEKGYSKEQASWVSQFVGEAYKVRRIIGSDDISGNRPYFLLDSSAHYTGAMIANEAMNKKSFEEIHNNIHKARKQGLENAESSWDYLKIGKKIISNWID